MVSHIIKLCRLNQPSGFLLLMHPCWWATILAGEGSSINYYFLFLFTLGAISMRSAGCIINDIWDRNIDAKVKRTKNRPLASGAMRVNQAFIVLSVCLALGLYVFLQLNQKAQELSLYAFGLAIIYPLTKRFFFLPQLILGLAFNMGALIAWVAITGDISNTAILIYIAGVLWTLGYDTIYAFQDIKDDEKAGVRSSARTFGKFSILLILVFYLWIYILISMAGIINGYNFAFITLLPVLVNLLHQVFTVNIDEPNSCLAKFKQNAYITGFLVSIGIFAAKVIN